jgi:hypothetical protein
MGSIEAQGSDAEALLFQRLRSEKVALAGRNPMAQWELGNTDNSLSAVRRKLVIPEVLQSSKPVICTHRRW